MKKKKIKQKSNVAYFLTMLSDILALNSQMCSLNGLLTNTTSDYQPLDQEVIKCVQLNYCKLLFMPRNHNDLFLVLLQLNSLTKHYNGKQLYKTEAKQTQHVMRAPKCCLRNLYDKLVAIGYGNTGW
jgi:hypothetical protein